MEWRAHLLASRYFLASCRLRELAIRSGRHQPRHGPQPQRHSCPGRGIPKFGHAHRRCHVRAGQRHDLRAAVRKGVHAVRLNDTRSRQQHHPTDVDRYFWARCRSDAHMRAPTTAEPGAAADVAAVSAADQARRGCAMGSANPLCFTRCCPCTACADLPPPLPRLARPRQPPNLARPRQRGPADDHSPGAKGERVQAPADDSHSLLDSLPTESPLHRRDRSRLARRPPLPHSHHSQTRCLNNRSQLSPTRRWVRSPRPNSRLVRPQLSSRQGHATRASAR